MADQRVSSRTKSAAGKAARTTSTSRVLARLAQIPRVATPAGDKEFIFTHIWKLLQEMQQHGVSLQESVQTVDAKLEDVEGTLATLKRQGEGIALHLKQLEQTPHTPPQAFQGTGEEATPRPPIHSPTATRPHERATILNTPVDIPGYKSAWGFGRTRKPAGTTILGESRATTPEYKPSVPQAPITSQTPIAHRAPKPPKMREPEDLDGTKGKVAKQWVTKAAIWSTAQRPNYDSKEALVLRPFSIMKPGKAADWAQPHLERIIQKRPDAITTQLGSLEAFAETFEDPDATRVAARRIEALKQDGSVADYNTAFDNLRSDLKWNDEALRSQYDRGLQHQIKAQIRFLDPQPANLKELQAAALKYGNLYAEFDALRPAKTSHTSADKKGKGRDVQTTTTAAKSDVKSSLPNYVDKEERDARRKEGLCIKCGAPDHGMKQCKNGYSIALLSANKGAESKKQVKKESGKVGETRKVMVEEEEEAQESENK